MRSWTSDLLRARACIRTRRAARGASRPVSTFVQRQRSTLPPLVPPDVRVRRLDDAGEADRSAQLLDVRGAVRDSRSAGCGTPMLAAYRYWDLLSESNSTTAGRGQDELVASWRARLGAATGTGPRRLLSPMTRPCAVKRPTDAHQAVQKVGLGLGRGVERAVSRPGPGAGRDAQGDGGNPAPAEASNDPQGQSRRAAQDERRRRQVAQFAEQGGLPRRPRTGRRLDSSRRRLDCQSGASGPARH